MQSAKLMLWRCPVCGARVEAHWRTPQTTCRKPACRSAWAMMERLAEPPSQPFNRSMTLHGWLPGPEIAVGDVISFGSPFGGRYTVIAKTTSGVELGYNA